MTLTQKQQFEKEYIGKHVAWKVQVDAVCESAHEKIMVCVIDPITPLYDSPQAYAYFSESEGHKPIALKGKDWISLQGTIERFSFVPQLKDCQFERMIGT